MSKSSYSDYYRLYTPHFYKQINPTYLYVYLIPKKTYTTRYKKKR